MTDELRVYPKVVVDANVAKHEVDSSLGRHLWATVLTNTVGGILLATQARRNRELLKKGRSWHTGKQTSSYGWLNPIDGFARTQSVGMS